MESDARLYSELISEIQTLRGTVYREENILPLGNIDEKGQHSQEADFDSWHIAIQSPAGKLVSSIRILLREHGGRAIPLSQLHFASALHRMEPQSRAAFNDALQLFLDDSRHIAPIFIEVSRLVTDKRHRNTSVPIINMAAVVAMSRIFGGARGIAAATTQYNWASVLRRLGMTELETEDDRVLGSYYDPLYGCSQQLLGLDTCTIASWAEPTVCDIEHGLATCTVFVRSCKPMAEPLPQFKHPEEHKASFGRSTNAGCAEPTYLTNSIS
jgi:hypothetical protein